MKGNNYVPHLKRFPGKHCENLAKLTSREETEHTQKVTDDNKDLAL